MKDLVPLIEGVFGTAVEDQILVSYFELVDIPYCGKRQPALFMGFKLSQMLMQFKQSC